MAEMTLTRMRLTGGVWEGLLNTARTVQPRLWLRHQNDIVCEPELHPTASENKPGAWLVRFQLPLDRLTDGVQIFTVEDAETGTALAHETIIAGETLKSDLRAEVALLRAELDLVKRAFRAHCAEN